MAIRSPPRGRAEITTPRFFFFFFPFFFLDSVLLGTSTQGLFVGLTDVNGSFDGSFFAAATGQRAEQQHLEHEPAADDLQRRQDGDD